VAKGVKSGKARKTEVYGTNGVLYSFPRGAEGPMQIKIDFAQVAEPAGYYYADALVVKPDSDLQMAVLTFGRRDTSSNRFGDRIDVVMPMRSLPAFFASSREVENTVEKVIASSGGATEPEPVTLPKEFVSAPTLYANAIFVAVGDGESTLDFYHMSPRQTHFAKFQKMPIQIQPTIRVILSSVLTKHFFDGLRPLARERAVPQQMTGDQIRAARSH
jgi:hypothetical protein